MYVIRRVWKVKPGTARQAATLVAKMGEVYEKAGQRQSPKVYFNGGTLPGDSNRVYLEWTAEVIDSPYRSGNEIPAEARAFGAKLRDLQEENWIEFYEMLTPEKHQDI